LSDIQFKPRRIIKPRIEKIKLDLISYFLIPGRIKNFPENKDTKNHPTGCKEKIIPIVYSEIPFSIDLAGKKELINSMLNKDKKTPIFITIIKGSLHTI
jgi:hypothetical protein